MAWVANGPPVIRRLTRAEALAHLELEHLKRDRSVKEWRVQLYRTAIQRRRFRSPEWAVCYCLETESTIRVNGAHTSKACATVDVLPDDLYVQIQFYTADTMQDVVDLYGTFDAKEGARRAVDIYRAHASVLEGFDNYGDRLLSATVTAIAYFDNRDRVATIKSEVKAAKLAAHEVFGRWLYDLMQSGGAESRKSMERSPVIAAMFGCYNRDPNAAGIFWTLVRDETGAMPQLPDRKLARFLATTVIGRPQVGKDAKDTADTDEMFRKCSAAWNAWRSNKMPARLAGPRDVNTIVFL